MARVLVTGGAGYIGSHCVKALLQRGDEVVIYDNLSTGFREALAPESKFIFGDVRDTFLLGRVMKDSKIDSVIHFAAKLLVGESVEKPLDYYENNVGGTLSVLKSCEVAGVRNLIFSSTAAVYGNPLSMDSAKAGADDSNTEKSPARKTPPVKEEQVCRPESPYGTTKFFSERMISDFASQGKIRATVLRYFNVAGANVNEGLGQRSLNATHLIKVCCEVALGVRPHLEIFGDDYPTKDGTGVRDYIHVEDLVTAHLLALDELSSDSRSPFEVFNVGYGHGYSVKEVLETFNKVCGKSLPVEISPRRPGDLAEVVANVEKIQRSLKFNPKKDSLQQICKDAFAWEKAMRARL